MFSVHGKSRVRSLVGRSLRPMAGAQLTTLRAGQQSKGNGAQGRLLLAGAFLGLATACVTLSESKSASDAVKRESLLDEEKFSTIIVGGGTAGCTVAYLTAKWMQENSIPGNVLLLDRGVDFFDAKNGPSPAIKNWFENWGTFGEAHPAEREDGTLYPVTVSEHLYMLSSYFF